MAEEDILDFIPDDEILEAEDDIPSKTYFLDYENGKIGEKIDGIEAVKQAIIKAILTPRFYCLIYDSDYGCELQDEMKHSPSEEYLTAIIPELVADTLVPDERIISVGDFDVTSVGDKLEITFNVSTIFGSIEIEEVV